MITLDEAKALKPGDILLDDGGKRWKVNGQVQTWKRDEGRIRVPLKHGLYAHDALTDGEFQYDPALCLHVCNLLTPDANTGARLKRERENVNA